MLHFHSLFSRFSCQTCRARSTLRVRRRQDHPRRYSHRPQFNTTLFGYFFLKSSLVSEIKMRFFFLFLPKCMNWKSNYTLYSLFQIVEPELKFVRGNSILLGVIIRANEKSHPVSWQADGRASFPHRNLPCLTYGGGSGMSDSSPEMLPPSSL